MLRTKDFKVYYTKQELLNPTDFELEISNIAIKLLEQIHQENILYRSTGIILEKFGEQGTQQLQLYIDTTEETKTKISTMF